MSEEWPLLGPAHPIEGFVEPMVWGRSNYTVIGVPQALGDRREADRDARRRTVSRPARGSSIGQVSACPSAALWLPSR
jgi:hypothetical protein